MRRSSICPGCRLQPQAARGVCACAAPAPGLWVMPGERMGRQTVRRFVPTGGQCGRHLHRGRRGLSWLCGGCGDGERPSPCVCGVCAVPRAKHFSSGRRAGGCEPKDGQAGPERARPVRFESRSLTPTPSRQPPRDGVCASWGLDSEDLGASPRYFFSLPCPRS